MGLLISIFNASNYIMCVLLSNQKCMIQPTLISLHPNEYSQKSHYYSFAFKLDRCVGSFYTLNDVSNKVCIPNKTEDLNLSVFNVIKGMNESKTLTKHISFECKCRFDGKKCNSGQWWNNDKCRYECKKFHICEKDYIWNPSICNYKNGKYLASIMDDSAITCDEVIESYDEETNTIPTSFSEKKATCKTQNYYILLAFLLSTIVLMIAVSIYCYLIKYQAKQKHLLQFHVTNIKLREVLY